LVLRLGVGLVMALHGWQKWSSGADGWRAGGMIEGMGMPGGAAVAWLVMLVELVGGVLLIVGLLTRLSASLIAVVMLVALTMVKLPGPGLIAPQGGGAGGELDLALMVGALAIAFLGAGALSLDKMLGIED